MPGQGRPVMVLRSSSQTYSTSYFDAGAFWYQWLLSISTGKHLVQLLRVLPQHSLHNHKREMRVLRDRLFHTMPSHCTAALPPHSARDIQHKHQHGTTGRGRRTSTPATGPGRRTSKQWERTELQTNTVAVWQETQERVLQCCAET